MANVEVSQDNTQEWLDAMGSALAHGLEQIGFAAEGHAKAKCLVDTGRLRNSITHAQVDGHTEAIGTNVEYGKYVELGTSRMDAQPFLVSAISGHVDEHGIIQFKLEKG